jgi:hypothetical protein
MNRDASVEEITELLYNNRDWLIMKKGWDFERGKNYEFEISKFEEYYHLNSSHIEEKIGCELSPEQWSRVGDLYRKKTRDELKIRNREEQNWPSLLYQWTGYINGPERIFAMIIIYLRAKEFGILPLRQLLFEEFCVNTMVEDRYEAELIDLIGISEAHEIEDEITSTARRKLESWSDI